MTCPTLTNLIALLADYSCVSEASIQITDTLESIGIADSLDHVQIISEIEEHFDIEIPESLAPTLTTVAALHEAIQQAQALQHS